MASSTFRIWRGDAAGGGFHEYTTEISEGMVVLDAVHQIQAAQRARSRGAMELQSGKMRLLLGRNQRASAADVHDEDERPAGR